MTAIRLQALRRLREGLDFGACRACRALAAWRRPGIEAALIIQSEVGQIQDNSWIHVCLAEMRSKYFTTAWSPSSCLRFDFLPLKWKELLGFGAKVCTVWFCSKRRVRWNKYSHWLGTEVSRRNGTSHSNCFSSVLHWGHSMLTIAMCLCYCRPLLSISHRLTSPDQTRLVRTLRARIYRFSPGFPHCLSPCLLLHRYLWEEWLG